MACSRTQPTRLHKFAALPPSHRRLLVAALALVALVRAGLWLLPFRWLRQIAGKGPAKARDVAAQWPVDAIAWAVTTASRYVPGATCLTQALATQILLHRAGRSAQLRIGVARSQGAGIDAHAWIECDGQVVIGRNDEFEQYTVLPPL